MSPLSFSHPLLAWAHVLLLATFLVAATVYDWRHAILPRRLTMAGLVVGLVANLTRGGLLAFCGQVTWLLPASHPALGVLDGGLFALAGSAVGFGLFLVLWLAGTCGGGDVKLFAALGAWLGPQLIVAALAASILALLVLLMGRRLAGAGQQRWHTYALPAALGTLVVLVWTVRKELGLMA